MSLYEYSVSGKPCSRITVPFGFALRTIIRLSVIPESRVRNPISGCGACADAVAMIDRPSKVGVKIFQLNVRDMCWPFNVYRANRSKRESPARRPEIGHRACELVRALVGKEVAAAGQDRPLHVVRNRLDRLLQ